MTGWAIAGSAVSYEGLRAEQVMPGRSCRPTLRQTLGPYPLPNSPDRSDIRENCEGIPLYLTFNVLDDYFCTPIEGARIDIWHSDANGLYSGVANDIFDLETMKPVGEPIDMTGTTFLRGCQFTDSSGKAEFTTIVPGWYTGRIAHIHVQTIIRNLEWTAHATQLYLPGEVERKVYETAPYKKRGQNPIGMERDFVIRGDAAALSQLTLRLSEEGAGYRGVVDLAVSF